MSLLVYGSFLSEALFTLLDGTMKSNLVLAHELLALEAYVSSDLGNLFSRTFPAIADGFSHFANMFDKDEKSAALSPTQRDMLKDLTKHKYLDVAELTAFCPEGLDTNLNTYTKALAAAVDHCSLTYNKLSPEYVLILSRLINQSDYQLDTRETEKIFMGTQKVREEKMKDIGNCFKKGSTVSKCTLETLVQRNSDWHEVFTRTEAINTVINKIDRRQLAKSIKEITSLMDMIKTKMERGELKHISPAVVRGISEGAYQLASEIEMYAAVHYRVMELNGTLNQTVEHYLKAVNP